MAKKIVSSTELISIDRDDMRVLLVRLRLAVPALRDSAEAHELEARVDTVGGILETIRRGKLELAAHERQAARELELFIEEQEAVLK